MLPNLVFFYSFYVQGALGTTQIFTKSMHAKHAVLGCRIDKALFLQSKGNYRYDCSKLRGDPSREKRIWEAISLFRTGSGSLLAF